MVEEQKRILRLEIHFFIAPPVVELIAVTSMIRLCPVSVINILSIDNVSGNNMLQHDALYKILRMLWKIML